MPLAVPLLLAGLTVLTVAKRKTRAALLFWVPCMLGWPAFMIVFLWPIRAVHSGFGEAFFELIIYGLWGVAVIGLIVTVISLPWRGGFRVGWALGGLGLAVTLGVGVYVYLFVPGRTTDVFYAVDEQGNPIRDFTISFSVSDDPRWSLEGRRTRMGEVASDMDGLAVIESWQQSDLRATAHRYGTSTTPTMYINADGTSYANRIELRDKDGRRRIVFDSPK